MKRGRPVEGAKVVDDMDGSQEAKRKVRAVLQSLAGERPVDEICAELGIGKTAFYELRARVLQAALSGSEPKPAGRPAYLAPPGQAEIGKLKAEIDRLRLDLEVAHVREEIMLAMPQVFEPLKKKLGKRKRRGKRGPAMSPAGEKPAAAPPAGAVDDSEGEGGGGKGPGC